MFFKNEAGQTIQVFAFNTVSGAEVIGDAANISVAIRKNDGVAAPLSDTSGSEPDALLLPGYYDFDLTQAETNANKLQFAAVSSTPNVTCIVEPSIIYPADRSIVIGPIITHRQLVLVRGDEYSSDTDQPLEFTLDELAGMTITDPVFLLRRQRHTQTIEGTASVVPGDPPVVTVALTSEQTEELVPGGNAYNFTLTVLMNGERRTVRNGTVTVDADIPAPA